MDRPWELSVGFERRPRGESLRTSIARRTASGPRTSPGEATASPARGAAAAATWIVRGRVRVAIDASRSESKQKIIRSCASSQVDSLVGTGNTAGSSDRINFPPGRPTTGTRTRPSDPPASPRSARRRPAGAASRGSRARARRTRARPATWAGTKLDGALRVSSRRCLQGVRSRRCLHVTVPSRGTQRLSSKPDPVVGSRAAGETGPRRRPRARAGPARAAGRRGGRSARPCPPAAARGVFFSCARTYDCAPSLAAKVAKLGQPNWASSPASRRH